MASSGIFGITELRVVLLGNIGSGKSASGNTLLGTSHFDCKLSASPVTQECKAETVTRRWRRVKVVDTPGLTAEIVTDTTKEKLLQCLQLSDPGPHIFLLVIPLGRFTQEEKDTVQRAAQLFKEHFYKFTIILFTFKDNLKNGSIHDYISTESLQQLLRKCGNRYHAFNNNNRGENDQAEQLLMKMDSLLKDNCEAFYKLDVLEHQQMMEQARRRRYHPLHSLPYSLLCPSIAPPSIGPSIVRKKPKMEHAGLPLHHPLHHPLPPPSIAGYSFGPLAPPSIGPLAPPSIGYSFGYSFGPLAPPSIAPCSSYSFDDEEEEVDLKEEFEKLKIHGLTEENLKKQAKILEKWKEQLESKEKQLNGREEQIRNKEGEMEEKKKKLKEHLLKLSEDL